VATPYYIPETNVPLPPKDSDVLSTACDYCIVACGFKVYRWPVAGGRNGGPKAEQNAFNEDSRSTRWGRGWRPTSTTSCCTKASRTMS